MIDPILIDVLNELEARELPLLSWGVTDSAFEKAELLELLQTLQPESDPGELLAELLKSAFIFRRGLKGNKFRTRMAETVRLARHLKQWSHDPQSDWTTAKALVSDQRFLTRPRVAPIRNVLVDQLKDRLRSQLGQQWTTVHETTVDTLLDGRSISGFQARATESLLNPVGGGHGTCITAGTGLGKTLAFYLPALTHALSLPRPTGVPRIIAIYPRIELLRDQLRSLLKTLAALEANGAKNLRVGVIYGATPYHRNDAEKDKFRGWGIADTGLISPMVDCLKDDCAGKLIWPNGETTGRLLRCDTCGDQLESLIFTRKALQSQSPEILLTTTESLNRLLGQPKMRQLLIGDREYSPDFILLDEIHTYAGTHGAQVANLIRRWRSEMSTSSHVVGLSATLADPAGFFSQLIGTEAANIATISPFDAEMVEVGREYFMALRGIPGSQTSLLTTTTHTAMLMRRMLDPEPDQPSGGVYGSRVFAFADKLDLVNRLYSQLQDAEGWQPNGVDRKPGGSIAALRATGVDNQLRDNAGQLWDAAEALGMLIEPVVVERATAQSPRIGRTSDIVVATSSLEVGVNDPNVGAIIQHKALQDAAQFVQRRGRAGRDPKMRSWTTVVLSDYGRDRLAFHAYEALFSPLLQPTHLPIRNRAILKMQATWWVIDYLTGEADGTDLRSLLQAMGPDQKQVVRRVLAVAKELLTANGLNKLQTKLIASLKISKADAQSVLFDHPRGIATTVLPTIIRRLQAVIGQTRVPDNFTWDDPLTNFVPRSLFSPLLSPEVRLVLPPRGTTKLDSVSKSMREFAPGKVNYRYALKGKGERMWIKPPESTEPTLDLETFCPDHLLLTTPPGFIQDIVQPRSIKLSLPADNVSDSSYGTWNWEGFFAVNGQPAKLDIPLGSSWEQSVTSVTVMTHRSRAPLTVWRIARSVDVERQVPSEPLTTRHRLQLAGRDTAIGFTMDVDAIRLDVTLPVQVPNEPKSALVRALRTSYFEHLVVNDPELVRIVSSAFLREWLAQLALGAVITAAIDGDCNLTEISNIDLSAAIDQIARSVFGAEGPPPSHQGSERESDLVSAIGEALEDEEVVTALKRCLTVLHAPLPSLALRWVQERYASTITAGFIGAVQAVCPDLDVDELCGEFEIVTSDDALPFARITISEDQPGGTGLIETTVDQIVDDPRAFWAVMTKVLGPGDGERIDAALRQFLDERQNRDLANEIANVREASDLHATTEAWSSLKRAMFRRGIEADQTVISALAARFLRPGGDATVAQLSAELLDFWDLIEDRLGVEVGLRVFAYLAASDKKFSRSLDAVGSGADQSPEWAIGQIVGLLWSRGRDIRASNLRTYNPYAPLPSTERLLVDYLMQSATDPVQFSSTDWKKDLAQQLHQDGEAQIICPDEAAAVEVLHQMVISPTAVGALELYPRIIGVQRSPTQITLMLDLREAQQ